MAGQPSIDTFQEFSSGTETCVIDYPTDKSMHYYSTGQQESHLPDIHMGNQGISKCREATRHSLYWPRVDSDLDDYIKRCQIYSKARASLPHELLLQH